MARSTKSSGEEGSGVMDRACGWSLPSSIMALAAALLCLAANPVRLLPTEPGDVALEYRVPATCPDEQAFRERTADLFDFHDPFVPTGSRATTNIRVEIEHDATGYHGTVTIYEPASGGSVRTSTEDHKSCESLVWILSHRMAMIIEKPSFALTPGKPAAPAPSAEDTATQRRLDAVEEALEDQREVNKNLDAKIAALQKTLNEEKRRMDLTYALSAGALLTANLTSNVGPGAWVGGELRTGPIALGLELRTVFPAPVAAGPYDYDLSQYVALLTPCGRYSYFFGCVVAGAGAQLSYDSTFPGGTKSRTSPLIQLGGRIGLEIPFGESMFAGRAWGEVLYSTPPTLINYIFPDVTYTGARPDVSAFFGLGLVAKFGKEGT